MIASVLRCWVRLASFASFALLASGCAKRQTPAEAAAPGEPLPSDIAALEQRLDDQEQELQTLGVELPLGELSPEADEAAAPSSAAEATPPDAADGAAPPSSADGATASDSEGSRVSAPEPVASAQDDSGATKRRRDADRCERICELADATCTLADHICELATRHAGAMRYQDACRRAEDQCRQASTACQVCS